MFCYNSKLSLKTCLRLYDDFMTTLIDYLVPFQAIIGGCACFWGSILGMGMTYMLVVLLKKWFEPQEIAKEED